MIESLACFKLNNTDRKILLYTYNEPYNGMDEYLKIYAIELDSNNNIVNGNMSEETHSQVKSAIAMMGKNQADSLNILPIPQVSLENVVGKAFAIPTVFKNGIKDTANNQLQVVGNVSNDVVINNIIKDDSSKNVDIVEEKKSPESVEENIIIDNSNQLEATEKLNSEVVRPTTGVEIPSSFKDNVTEQDTLKTDIFHDEEYNPLESYMTSDTSDNPISTDDENITTISDVKENSSVYDEIPSLSEVEDALNVIIKYVKSLKKNHNDVKENNENALSNSLNNAIVATSNLVDTKAIEEKSEQLTRSPELSSIDFTNEPVFPDDELDTIESESKIENGKNGYVAVQNIGQTPINNGVFTENIKNEKEDPVVMPDNFIGKQDSKFEITGLGPSTLSADEPQVKYVA